MSDNSFDAAQKALRNRAVVDLEEPLPDEQPPRWWLRILVVLVFFGFGAIVWLSWQDNAGDGTPTLVAAPPGPAKEKPADRGGMELRNNGTEIPSVLSGDTDKDVRTAEVGPIADSRPPDRPREEVIPPAPPPQAASSDPVASAPTADPGAVASTGTSPATTPSIPLSGIEPAAGAEGSQPAAPAAPDANAPAAPDAQASQSAIVVQPLPPVDGVPIAPPEPPVASGSAGEEAQDEPRSLLPPDAPSAPTTPVPPTEGELAAVAPDPVAPVEPELVPEPEPVVAPPPQRAVSGVRIQVASLRSQGAANTAWERLVQRNRDVLGNLRSVITQAEVRGATYYRAQAEGFGSRAEAQAACAKLKSRGTDCLVVAR